MPAPDPETKMKKPRPRFSRKGIQTAIVVGALLMIAAVVYAVLHATDPTPDSATAAEVRAGQEASSAAASTPPDLQQ